MLPPIHAFGRSVVARGEDAVLPLVRSIGLSAAGRGADLLPLLPAFGLTAAARGEVSVLPLIPAIAPIGRPEVKTLCFLWSAQHHLHYDERTCVQTAGCPRTP